MQWNRLSQGAVILAIVAVLFSNDLLNLVCGMTSKVRLLQFSLMMLEAAALQQSNNCTAFRRKLRSRWTQIMA